MKIKTKKELEKENEQLRVQLAGCSVAAMGYGKRLNKKCYGYSIAYEDVRKLYNKYKKLISLE